LIGSKQYAAFVVQYDGQWLHAQSCCGGVQLGPVAPSSVLASGVSGGESGSQTQTILPYAPGSQY
jgi:hypothetical protein